MKHREEPGGKEGGRRGVAASEAIGEPNTETPLKKVTIEESENTNTSMRTRTRNPNML